MSILSLSLKPMMAKRRNAPFDDKDWIFEFKWDGIRAFIYKGGGKQKIETRRGNVITRKFPEITIEPARDLIVDGEIVVVREGRPDFQAVQTRTQVEDPVRIKILSETLPAVFVAFDIVYLDGKWLNENPLEERKEFLAQAVEENDHVLLAPFVEERGVELYERARKMGFEGIMAKQKGTPYIFGKRVPFWLKIKESKTIDAVICGLTLGEGKRAPYFGSLVLGLYKNGDLVHIGNVGTGFSEKEMKELMDLLLPLQVPEPPCKVRPEDIRRDTIWVRPTYVAEVAYQAITEDKKLRMPRFLRLRLDKHPEECTWDQIES